MLRPAPGSGEAASTCRGAGPAKQMLLAGFKAWDALREGRPTCTRGRGGQTVHPSSVAAIDVAGRHRRIVQEVDSGTAELRRNVRFYFSGSWWREFATFPEIRIVTTHQPRLRRMLAEVEDAVRSFNRAESDALATGLVVAETCEAAFLVDPGGVVWTRAFAADVRESLLPRVDEG